jgi:hypothetical protein
LTLQKEDTMAIRPFHLDIPESDLTDLRRRITATRLPERETVTDFSQGVPLVSSARLYWEWKLGFFTPKAVEIPVAVSAFPDELYQAPRTWAEQAYPKLIHYNKLPKGGHFAAWEQPALLSEELRAGFKSLRA